MVGGCCVFPPATPRLRRSRLLPAPAVVVRSRRVPCSFWSPGTPRWLEFHNLPGFVVLALILMSCLFLLLRLRLRFLLLLLLRFLLLLFQIWSVVTSGVRTLPPSRCGVCWLLLRLLLPISLDHFVITTIARRRRPCTNTILLHRRRSSSTACSLVTDPPLLMLEAPLIVGY